MNISLLDLERLYKAKALYRLLTISMIYEHVHGLELQRSFKFWSLCQRSKSTENLIDQLFLYFLFWTCMSEIKYRPYFSFNL